ncbi:MAG TPA: hypothetical protein VFV92_01950, partial [Candidatus Bathyarchaeia archaeon]|nr:hypothetical protein [Candidatus Bathyarchaeia archaeon]
PLSLVAAFLPRHYGDPCIGNVAAQLLHFELPPLQGRRVTPDENTRMFDLCQRIAAEKDRERFLELVRELNDLLNEQDSRLAEKDKVASG